MNKLQLGEKDALDCQMRGKMRIREGNNLAKHQKMPMNIRLGRW